jgi:hypothetical protein
VFNYLIGGIMSKRSLVRRPCSAYRTYINSRKQELVHRTGLPLKDIIELITEEWSLMTDEQKSPFVDAFEQEKAYYDTIKEDIEEIDVDSFMETIKEARKQKTVKDEFKEDDVLSIVNHRNKWKKTWTKQKKEKVRIQKVFNELQAKKIKRLKLN